jgi:MraZ protein
MFFGRYDHTLDEKGRITIPVRFREALLYGAYITRGFDQNLLVWVAADFEEVARRVNQMSITDPTARILRRMIFSTAEPVEIDRAGRILIPGFLREAGGLGKMVVIVGTGNSYFEIWSPERWAEHDVLLQDQSMLERLTALDLPLKS